MDNTSSNFTLNCKVKQNICISLSSVLSSYYRHRHNALLIYVDVLMFSICNKLKVLIIAKIIDVCHTENCQVDYYL